jgi:3-methylfumaryl-CoA hydratase
MTIDIDRLNTWIGRQQSNSEYLDVWLARRFAATFELDPVVADGEIAAELIHLCLTRPTVPTAELGHDGHPALGTFLPPVPLPRRMWAGGSFDFLAPIRIGDTVSRASTIRDVTRKQGRAGLLCFITVDHEIFANGRLALVERQDIVYRDTPRTSQADTTTPAQTEVATHQKAAHPSSVLLFRYSALTFNGHRIHYDRNFCVETEGYPGLVVHGPLQATWLCSFAADICGKRPVQFEFRSIAPLFDTDEVTLNAVEDGDGLRLWTANGDGKLAMTARARW